MYETRIRLIWNEFWYSIILYHKRSYSFFLIEWYIDISYKHGVFVNDGWYDEKCLGNSGNDKSRRSCMYWNDWCCCYNIMLVYFTQDTSTVSSEKNEIVSWVIQWVILPFVIGIVFKAHYGKPYQPAWIMEWDKLLSSQHCIVPPNESKVWNLERL